MDGHFSLDAELMSGPRALLIRVEELHLPTGSTFLILSDVIVGRLACGRYLNPEKESHLSHTTP